MTARPVRRHRRALVGMLLAIVLVIVAGALTVVGVLTLLDSEAGVTVEADDRPVVALPSTPNALLAVTDDQGRLTSVVVATLRPDGVGGTLVTFPVDADADAGFGSEPRPLDTVFDPDDPEAFRQAVESMLAITIERVAVVDQVALADLLAPVLPIDVDLPARVIDSDRAGSGVIARPGRRELQGRLVAAALTAFDEDAAPADRHALDVAIWSGLAAAAPAGGAVTDDAFGADDATATSTPAGSSSDSSSVSSDTTSNTTSSAAPDSVSDSGATGPWGTNGAASGAPDSAEELFARLWRGPVVARDIAVAEVAGDPPDRPEAVVLDRRDGLLVFTQVSPALVSKPNQSLSFRIEARFDEAQLEAGDGLFASNSDLVRQLIGELLFFQANPVSSDLAPATEGAPSVTRVEVADARFLDDLEEFAPLVFGESDVVLASRVIEGVDVVVRLGTGYIEAKTEAVDEGAGDAPAAADDVADGAGSTVAGDE